MTGDVRRAGGYFLVGALSLIAPVLDGATSSRLAAISTVAPFAFVAAVALASTRGPVFELFARNSDREEGRLYGLASFALAVAGLAVLLVGFELPTAAFVASVFILTTGNLGQMAVATRLVNPFVVVSAFVVSGMAGGIGSIFLAGTLGAATPSLPLATFFAASGALLAALIRSALHVRDDSLVLLSTGLVIWFLLELGLDATTSSMQIAVGLGLTVLLGGLAYGLGTASITGMLTGVLLALFAVVLGGYGWFVLLMTFFGVGGLASKYRYEEKLERGIAQENEGARDSGNVLANSAVALVAVVAYAGAVHVSMDAAVFRFAFAGAVAAALADTLSSEFGGLFDKPRLITTFERVEAGTDGGVTWQGVVAGLVGSGCIAGLGALFFGLGVPGTVTILAAGAVGMTVDSILGATLEGGRLDNQSVNLLATLSAGLVAAAAGLTVL